MTKTGLSFMICETLMIKSVLKLNEFWNVDD